jgi:serine protease
MANNWINHGEIPNNGTDDDGNGYIDDYLGWDPVNDNDNIDGGSHGVNVAGMIGAVGNNSTGCVGVNWGVKIMNMTYGNINDEAQVIEAYTYPLVMRNMYEANGGLKGAYVVATNSSWGINNGDPADAPLWCAFYDTLGAAGILSCGATANNNVNIDVVGDLPTACASEYMVSVTATNNNDVRTFSAYGATTVDLGAPGEDVYTTASGGGYTTTSGTSFASPATAGAIALVYSSPCASLAAISHSDPALAAQMVRDAIFNGVDPIANLVGECVTGGRLNTRNAIDEIMNNCGGGCITPFNLSAESVTDVSASLTWGSLPDQNSFNISWGEVGGAESAAFDITSPYALSGLNSCTDYFFMVQADCDTATSDWSDTLYFSTDGCCLPPSSVNIDAFTSNNADVSWSSVLAAMSYNVRWRPIGAGVWTEVDNVVGTSLTIDIGECTEYEVQVSTNCSINVTTDFSASAYFTSSGCGACVDMSYCPSTADNADDDWIDQVDFNTISNNSGSDGGYGDFTTMTTSVERGSTHTLTVTPDYDFFFELNVTTSAWIDWNQDGSFDNSELVLGPVEEVADVAVAAEVTVPTNAVLGATRMRIKTTEGNNNNPCQETFNYGEVEDYCVTVVDTTTGIRNIDSQLVFGLMPNPTTGQFTIRLNDERSEQYSVTVSDLQGRVLIVHEQFSGTNASIDASNLTAGTYMVRVIDQQGRSSNKPVVIR